MTEQSLSVIDAQIDGDVCRLLGVIDFDTAPTLLSTVAGYIETKSALTIDFSAVTQANSAALALLLEWKTLAARHNCTLNQQNLPDSIRQLSEICQVSEFI